MFIGSNRVVVCSESSIIRSDVYFFRQHSTILFQWFVASVFQYTFVETFTAKFKFNRGDVIAPVCLTTQTEHLHASELFFEGTRLLYYHVVCFRQHVWGNKYATTSAVKPSIQSVDRNLCPPVLNSSLIQSSSFLTAGARYSEPVSISNSSNLITSQNLMKKLQYSSNNRSVAYWRMKNSTTIGSLYSTVALESSTW